MANAHPSKTPSTSNTSPAHATAAETPASCPSEEGSVSVKGSENPAPAREWTALSVEEERRQLERELADARASGDDGEVRRIESRLRLLTP